MSKIKHHDGGLVSIDTTPKKKFLVTQTQPAVEVFTYIVEAESKEEAVRLIKNGHKFDSVNYDVINTSSHADYHTEVIT